MDRLGFLHGEPPRGEERRTPAVRRPCVSCGRRATCKTPCRRLEELLPGPRVAEQFVSIPANVADEAGRWRQSLGQEKREIFRIFLAHRKLLSPEQWKCVELVYGQDLSTHEAAAELGIGQSTVARNLVRARRRLLLKTCIVFRTSGGTRGEGGPAR